MAAIASEKLRKNATIEKRDQDEFFIRRSNVKLVVCRKKGRATTTKHHFLHRLSKLIIMSAVWWCASVDNCVPVVVTADKQFRCPNVCICYDEYKKIFCQDGSLRVFPSNIPATANWLVFTGNNIGSLDKTVFKTLTRLKKLELGRNRIYDIPVTAFYGLNNLIELDLSNNKLTKIPHAIDYLKSLKTLSLRNNPITGMTAFQFVHIRATLVALDLGQLRHLNLVSPAAFGRLTKLQTLKMDSCNLMEIPNLLPLVGLRDLDLAANRFTVVRSNAFTGLNQLKSISLESSQIKIIEDDAFSKLYSLQMLNLMRNNITTLGASTFEKNLGLNYLYLTHNPWMCNCNLMPLAGYLNDNGFCPPDECPVCERPSIYRGEPVTTLLQDNTPPCAALIMNPPELTSLNVSVGGQAKIPCPTVGPGEGENEVTNVRWQLPDGKLLTHGRYTARVKKLDNGALNITNVLLKDKGAYTCLATLASSEVKNATVYLNVTTQRIPLSSSFFTTVTTLISMPITTKSPGPGRKSTTTRPTPTTTTTKRTTTSTTRTTALVSSSPINLPPPRVESKPEITSLQPTDIDQKNTTSQIFGTTNVIIGCFVSLTLLAAILLIIFYKIRRKNYKASTNHSLDTSDEGNKSNFSNEQTSNKEPSNTSYIPTNNYNLTTPDHHPSEIRCAMAQSVTRTWVETLPEHGANDVVRLPSSAVRVLPPTLEEMREMGKKDNPRLMFLTDDVKSKSNTWSRSSEPSAQNTALMSRTRATLPVQNSIENLADRGHRTKATTVKLGHTSPLNNKMTVKKCKEKSLLKHRDFNNRYSAVEMANNKQATQLRPQSCVNLTHTIGTDEIFTQEDATKNILVGNNGSINPTKPELSVKDRARVKSLEGLLNHRETEI